MTSIFVKIESNKKHINSDKKINTIITIACSNKHLILLLKVILLNRFIVSVIYFRKLSIKLLIVFLLSSSFFTSLISLCNRSSILTLNLLHKAIILSISG